MAWEADRNMRQKGVNWQLTAEDARIKLKRLHPTHLFLQIEYFLLTKSPAAA
jgi:hypothetical protein